MSLKIDELPTMTYGICEWFGDDFLLHELFESEDAAKKDLEETWDEASLKDLFIKPFILLSA